MEHLVFKGTEKRTAHQIALEVDSIGGQIDAYTSREHTSYSAKILGEHLPIAVDILSDILLHSVFDPPEIEKERNVILEEIKMLDDNPGDYIYDAFYKSIWENDHPLAWPIQGTEETVKGFSRNDLLSYLDQQYSPQKIIIAAAGNLQHDRVVELINESFGALKRQGLKKEKTSPVFKHSISMMQKDLEQVTFYAGVEGLRSTDEDRYKAYILNIILGGSMSSRLFQKIREERGLVYNIYSFNNLYKDAGLFGVFAGTSPGQVTTVLDLFFKEVRLIIDEKVEENVLQQAKEQLKANIVLSLESSSSRMTQLARQELYFGRHFTVDEVYQEIEKVSVGGIQDISRRLFFGKTFSFTALGRLEGCDVSSEFLKV